MHYQLRTEAGTPLQKALSVGLGVLVGSTPLYGLHFTLCVALATLFRLNRIHAYLASHINNLITLPLFLYVEFGTGHWLRTGAWPELSLGDLRRAGALEFGYDLFIGTLVVGPILATILTVVAYLIGQRSIRSTAFRQLLEEVSRRYTSSGILHWEFVRGKLNYDPFYRQLLDANILPRHGRLVDLGCGRGILLSMLRSAATLGHDERSRHPEFAIPDLVLMGVESRPTLARVARAALGHEATIELCSPAEYETPASQIIVIMDVLHTLSMASQERVLSRAAKALAPGGILLVRDVDRSSGLRFRLGWLWARLTGLLTGGGWPRFHYRSQAEWTRLLEQQALSVRVLAGWARKATGDILLEARKPAILDASVDPAPLNRPRPR